MRRTSKPIWAAVLASAPAGRRASIPTALREFEVQITAENSDTPNQPSDLLVASQKIREK